MIAKTTNGPELTVLSFGAGQDSTALLYMLVYDAAFRKKYAPGELIVIFSDTGDEHPMTYLHLVSVSRFCEEHGVEFIHVTPDMGYHNVRWKTLRTQWELNRTVGMKVGMKSCTDQLKFEPLYRCLNDRIAEKYNLPSQAKSEFRRYKTKCSLVEFAHIYGKIRVIIGLAADEEGRVAKADDYEVKGKQWLHLSVERCYPLIELGMNREACQRKISGYGHIVPPPSNCMLCPFMNMIELLWLALKHPDDFKAWVRFEKRKLAKFAHKGESNFGVFGKNTLPQILAKAKEKYGHMTIKEVEDYKFSHGHCVKSRY